MKKKKIEKVEQEIRNADTQWLKAMLFLVCSLIIFAIIVIYIQDIGFQPEDEVCLNYDCVYTSYSDIQRIENDFCENEKFLNAGVCKRYSNKVSTAHCKYKLSSSECLSWRDKTPEEKDLEHCKNLIIDKKEEQAKKCAEGKVYTCDDGLCFCWERTSSFDIELSDAELNGAIIVD